MANKSPESNQSPTQNTEQTSHSADSILAGIFSDPIKVFRMMRQDMRHLSDEEVQEYLDAQRKPGEPEPWPFSIPRKSQQ